MYCKKCGKQIPDDSRFCSYCGTDNSMDGADHATNETTVISSQTSNEHRPQGADSGKKKKKTGLVIFVVVLIAVIGCAFYYVSYAKKASQQEGQQPSQQASQQVFVFRAVGGGKDISPETIGTIEKHYQDYCYLIIEDTDYVLFNSEYKLGQRYNFVSETAGIRTTLIPYENDAPIILMYPTAYGEITVYDAVFNNEYSYSLLIHYETVSNSEAKQILSRYKDANIPG